MKTLTLSKLQKFFPHPEVIIWAKEKYNNLEIYDSLQIITDLMTDQKFDWAKKKCKSKF